MTTRLFARFGSYWINRNNISRISYYEHSKGDVKKYQVVAEMKHKGFSGSLIWSTSEDEKFSETYSTEVEALQAIEEIVKN